MPSQYAIGIDLGTTNSVLAYTQLGEDRPRVSILPVPQLVAASTIEARNMLPSFLYLGTDQDAAAAAFDLPWARANAYAVGALAVRQAADVPTRTVSSAKSWLAHSRVDRHQPILPWDAPPDVAKVSPVEASRRYLQHLVAAWTAAFPDAPIAEQQVVLTVPASFDASARELTREAALLAGLAHDMVLLEEPQAALYAWLADRGDAWRRKLNVGDTLLVCDIGGGTTDFTLIGVSDEGGELSLRRIAVGNHTLVGGDNMDLAIAHSATAAFSEKGVELNPWQSVSLWHACRTAKETLLGDNGPKKHPVAVLGRGSKLVGGTISVDLEREAIQELLVNGFFPNCDISDKPARRRASGFREIGLPYEADTAITRHLAAFLSAHATDGAPVRPTHVLFNGGVFKSPVFRERLGEVMADWFGKKTQPDVLEGNTDYDDAVARGAAYYGAAKRGRGVRIRGGAARSYYVGVETSGPAIPGAARPLQALCVVPFGMEEGTEADVAGEEIGLVVGEPAVFRFFSAAARKQDKPGALIKRWTDEEITETDSLEAHLPKPENVEEDYVPVRFHSKITELGMFELWCVSTISDQRWKLEFSVRENRGAS
ncbi:MAG TPA: Hsp70 family protein [Tepidisphaeraceae bacterium]|jgi:molecular chaperone DnaK (HSP70)|nr:Hsp70 family protein [Tepidisphaeraceae bacterium]